ncbi:MAG: hypothetical protein ABSA51_08950 [Anaerolineaceae bacterium]|jgi:signal transduction histidine kinase
MRTILLMSRNEDLQKAISAALADQFLLNICTTFEDVQARLTQAETSCPAILVDLSGQDRLKNRLTELKHEGIILLVILDDPGKREAAYCAGADDYLLLPIPEAEIAAHLLHRIQIQEKIEAQRQIIIEQECGVSIGRLTSHFCHEINNSMQATRGAVALALEEPDIPENLRPYFDLCDEETRRVVALVKKMRQIYHPSDASPSNLFLDTVLQESIELAADEMNSNNIHLVKDFGKNIPPIRGNCDLIQVALLSLLLNLSETLGKFEEGDIKADISQVEGNVQLMLSVENSVSNLPSVANLSPANEIITGQGGKIEIRQNTMGMSIRILFPTSM